MFHPEAAGRASASHRNQSEKEETGAALCTELRAVVHRVNASEVRINEFQSNYLIKINFTLHLEGYQEEELSNAFEASWSWLDHIFRQRWRKRRGLRKKWETVALLLPAVGSTSHLRGCLSFPCTHGVHLLTERSRQIIMLSYCSHEIQTSSKF